MVKIEFKEVPVELIQPDDSNPNKMSKRQFEALKKSIKKFGFIVPVVVNKDLVIADGFHRWKAAMELDMDSVYCVVCDVSDVDRRLIRQVMNKLRGSHDDSLDFEEFKFFDESGVLDELTGKKAVKL